MLCLLTSAADKLIVVSVVLRITTRVAHGKDAIHRHVAIHHPMLTIGASSPRLFYR